MTAELAEWDSFYVIVGSAAGALIGLQFVVMTLLAEKPIRDAGSAGSAFATPTIVHFCAVLFLSAAMRVPWPTPLCLPVVWGLNGAAGLVYTGIVARRVKKQPVYNPAFEDWLFHVALPAVCYSLLVVAALTKEAKSGVFAVGAGALILLFVGIHNAWDAVAYHVLVNIHGSKKLNRNKKRQED